MEKYPIGSLALIKTVYSNVLLIKILNYIDNNVVEITCVEDTKYTWKHSVKHIYTL